MADLKLYRKRIIPSECILLKDDIIVKQNDDVIITQWNTINPKHILHHGCSCYFLREGYKVSKFYRCDNTLMFWYCDIVEYSFNETENALTVTDLLADVMIYPDGHVKVIDLDELAEALDRNMMTARQLTDSLRYLNKLLTIIYNDKFERLSAEINNLGL